MEKTPKKVSEYMQTLTKQEALGDLVLISPEDLRKQILAELQETKSQNSINKLSD